jgi:hypothetical protein
MADEPADVPVVQPPPRPAAQPFSFGLNGDHFVIGPNELLVNGKSAFVELRARTRIFESRNGEGIPSVTQRE